MIPLAYILSRFPETYESFIFREVHALTRLLGTGLPIFSLKPCGDRNIHEEGRPFLKTTYYPSLRTAGRAVPTLFSSSPARACMRQVFAAYQAQPWEGTKALVTLLLAAAIIPTIRRLHLRHIHAHWATMPALAAYFIKHVSGIPYSITAHAWDIYAETTMLREKLQAAEYVVTCTAANFEELLHLGARPGRLFLCYHGLDFDRLPPPVFDRSPDLRIVAVGRLVEQKGFADLIKACHLLDQRNVPFHCHIIGDGPLVAELRDLIAHYRLDQVVSLLGSRSQREVFCAYQGGTVLCVPSVIAQNGGRDGIPNVILEAMSQGLPVVASRVSGIPEVVQPPKTGWLVPPGNAPTLAATLQEIHQMPREAWRRAVAAYELVRSQFDVHKNTATLLQLFLRLTPTEDCYSEGGAGGTRAESLIPGPLG
jgi:colanic acid/amylovoran biosynthesis glycosyltransferase